MDYGIFIAVCLVTDIRDNQEETNTNHKHIGKISQLILNGSSSNGREEARVESIKSGKQ